MESQISCDELGPVTGRGGSCRSPVRPGIKWSPGSIPGNLQAGGSEGPLLQGSSFPYLLQLDVLSCQNLCKNLSVSTCACVSTYMCVYRGMGKGQRERVNTWFMYLDFYKGREIKGF